MTDFAFSPPPQASLAIADSAQRFPIRRVFCVGRNYAAHAREMGNDERDPPFFFMKPADAVVDAAGEIPYPPLTQDLHHEVELVIAIDKAGRDVAPENALDLMFGCAVGIDLTRRDLQDVAKKAARPWEWAKAFDASAPIGAIVPTSHDRTGNGLIWLSVNGKMRQEGNLGDMIWNVAEIIAAASRSVALAPGDLIMTGTPAGVGALQPGDRVEAGIDGIGTIAFSIAPRD
ncbi:FAA hydrolase family protein [Aliihoeflea aestuarii]|uniref:fumarylacetoacetate hydrolase family protein n=1 Tax=Aliihoeflea aestuarii TaxID=453840 RepID=UPI002095569A|nr:fumarylacetoacetate hydrolase family protein [Aliihoeflea aestuarii]MCO6392175.1 FAA hydrolase family protein [Aliihoeflea aestuarii]